MIMPELHAIVRVIMTGYQIQSHNQLALDDNSLSITKE